jgi:hypothetical protein
MGLLSESAVSSVGVVEEVPTHFGDYYSAEEREDSHWGVVAVIGHIDHLDSQIVEVKVVEGARSHFSMGRQVRVVEGEIYA